MENLWEELKAQNKSKWSIDCELSEGRDLYFIHC